MTKTIQPPMIGFGTFNSFQDDEKVAEAVREAIRIGYRHFDCAHMYKNEKAIGKAFRDAIAAGEVTRERLYICSKLSCEDMAPEDVEPACRKTLEDLGLDYVDCYMMHWPARMTKESRVVNEAEGGKWEFDVVWSGDRKGIAESYAAMERLVDLGLVRSLGVSNFDIRLLGDLLADCRIPPLTNEVELHPYLAQFDLVEYCQKMNVHPVAYSPLGKMGYKSPGQPDLLSDPVIQCIAEETGKTPAQVVLRWNVQRGASVIPKSLTPSRIASNYDVLDWTLTASQTARLDGLDSDFRFVRVDWFDFDVKPPVSVNTTPPGQALIKHGEVDEHGFYRNNFGRAGKHLHTEVIIKRGLLEPEDLAANAKFLLPEKCLNAPIHIITDTVVDKIYGEQVLEGLRAAGLNVHKAVMRSDEGDESGESSTEHHKTMGELMACADLILERGINKNSCIISLGGGVVNNLAGVLAGMLYRGVSLVHLPTTTMSTFDAALDFKQAVNHPLGKNLLGCYYPATTIAIDPNALSTLSERHVLNGISEALKHGLTQSKELTDTIVEPLRHGDLHKVLRDGAYLESICKAALEIKAPTLDDYEKTDFNEFCPQYGHAVGHAVEHTSWSGPAHSPLLHGEAVAVGMCVSAEVALLKGICTQKVVDEHYDTIGATGLPCYVPASMNAETVIRQMRFDKHTLKNPAMGLCAELGGMAMNPEGDTYSFEVNEEELVAALEANVRRRDADATCGKCNTVFAPSKTKEAAPKVPPFQAGALNNPKASKSPKSGSPRRPEDILGPALPFVREVDLEKLREYRRDYLRHRCGAARGARGEIVDIAATGAMAA